MKAAALGMLLVLCACVKTAAIEERPKGLLVSRLIGRHEDLVAGRVGHFTSMSYTIESYQRNARWRPCRAIRQVAGTASGHVRARGRRRAGMVLAMAASPPPAGARPRGRQDFGGRVKRMPSSPRVTSPAKTSPVP